MAKFRLGGPGRKRWKEDVLYEDAVGQFVSDGTHDDGGEGTNGRRTGHVQQPAPRLPSHPSTQGSSPSTSTLLDPISVDKQQNARRVQVAAALPRSVTYVYELVGMYSARPDPKLR